MPALALLVAVVASASAIAAGNTSGETGAPLPSQADVATAIESGVSERALAPLADPAAAEGVSLEGMQREEAVGLLNGVFGGAIEAAAGVYDELQEATLLSPNVAVLPDPETAETEAGDGDEPGVGSEVDAPQLGGDLGRDEAAETMPEAEARKVTGPPPEVPAEAANASLVDSTVPFQAGEGEETVDLSLERQDGILKPVAPLVETRIPGELGEEIEFPESGISIEMAGLANERSASISGSSVAFYPNVADDTDLAISPAPTGVETLTQLRSADSPDVTTYRFSLPSGASLAATEAGGAEVRSGEDLLLSVPTPTAIDASGEAVPVDLEVSGNTMRVQVEPKGSTPLPILVDPLFQTYEWAAKGTDAGICSNSFQSEPYYACNSREEWGYDVHESSWSGIERHMEATNGIWSYGHGMHIWARRQQHSGDHATILYAVPRYFKDATPPTSYIKRFKLSNLTWSALSPSPSPYLFAGIWNPSSSGWISYYTHTSQVGHGTNEPAYVYDFQNAANTNGKVAEVSINATENTGESSAHVYAGYAQVELGDDIPPQAPVPTIQSKWVNEAAPPLQFSTGDSGLGVFAISASTEESEANGQDPPVWKAFNGCVGVGDSACPLSWSSSEAKQPLTYNPNLLPTGIRYLKLVAEDPVGNKSAGSWEEVRVDHIAPTLALTGSITEQEQLGTRRASYVLNASGSDGNTEHPQSGIAKAEIKLDGKAVSMQGKQAEEWSPKCATRNCSLSAKWTLDTAGLAEGEHTIEVIATDAVGISATKSLTIETHAATPPTLALSGSMTEQASLGPSRPRYVLKAKSTATSGGFETPNLGSPATYASALGGTYGEGTARFFEPVDTATDGKGNVWVIDSVTRTANQLQQFNEKGEWLRSTGSSGNGRLKTPWGVAVDAANNVWVADTGNNRIVEFNEKGEFVLAFGTGVNKTKVDAGGTEPEKNLCTAASGNICQAATAGSLAGQMKGPKGIALTSVGYIWVVDTGNNRIQKFGPTGNPLSTVSGEGTEPGKVQVPTAITVAPDGSIWVADSGNNRIEQWTSSGVFARAVGTKGTGAGEFQNPSGIEADSTGAIWVSDFGNGRVQGFDDSGNFIQSFKDAAGSPWGTPRGLAIDANGSLWVADQYFFKAYRWTLPGFPVYASFVGGLGAGNGQFAAPVDVAADNSGNFWVLDSALNRLQGFDASGKWLRTAGVAGSGAGQLTSPRSLATDPGNNVWVADTGNNRIVEFNEKGEFVLAFGTGVNKTKVDAGGTEPEKNLCTAASGNICQAASAGSLAGQMKSPKGIASTAGGNIWVADTGNNRIQKFGPTGTLLNNVSGLGTEPGKLKEPAGIAVAPDGSIWVADTGNNRIEQWNSSIVLRRAVGKEGAGGGEFRAPVAIEADSSGNIWVGDQKNNRVEEFGEGGKYLGQFGANGSGRFSFSTATGIAVDATGNIWVADPGHFRVQKWTQEVPKSEITTALWLDSSQQNGLHGTCKGSSCMIEPQWTVESKALSAGSHSAKVKTTDGLGRSTESTVSFQIAPDTVKPVLEAGGELVNAPEGWVEQETYGFNATANDGGSGVTSIAFRIDGQQVASVTQTCPDGGCNETLSKQISMAPYAGGSHPAEIVATDGAGNTAKFQWTINVDPEGHISTQEAEATLEAVEETTEEAPIAPNEELLEPKQIEFGDNPELHQEGSKISSTGVPTLTTMSTNPAAGFTINSPYGETTIIPKVSEGTSDTSVVEGVAGVSPNASSQVDTVIRPDYNGVMVFQAIRSEASPEKYSWTVPLEEGQVLQLADSDHAEVLYESGKRAFLVTAEPAHDATGRGVPTSLEVDGNVLTLRVEFHSTAFVYPILAGSGWETSYAAPVLIQGPEDELEIEEREKAEHEAEQEEEPTPPPPASGYFTEAEAKTVIASRGKGEEIIPAPDPPATGTAQASSIPEKVVKPYKRCSQLGCGVWWVEERNPSYHYKKTEKGRATAYWQDGTQVHGESWRPWYYFPELEVDLCGAGFNQPYRVYAGEHIHLTVWLRSRITATAFTYDGDVLDFDNRMAMQIWVWPNGFQQRWDGHWEVTQEWIENGGSCSVDAL